MTAQPTTNADRIRGMSDEELSAFLDALCSDGRCSVCDNLYWCRRNNAPEPICKNHIRDWLKKPAEEE